MVYKKKRNAKVNKIFFNPVSPGLISWEALVPSLPGYYL
jgi:hypothetical protein